MTINMTDMTELNINDLLISTVIQNRKLFLYLKSLCVYISDFFCRCFTKNQVLHYCHFHFYKTKFLTLLQTKQQNCWVVLLLQENCSKNMGFSGSTSHFRSASP